MWANKLNLGGRNVIYYTYKKAAPTLLNHLAIRGISEQQVSVSLTWPFKGHVRGLVTNLIWYILLLILLYFIFQYNIWLQSPIYTIITLFNIYFIQSYIITTIIILFSPLYILLNICVNLYYLVALLLNTCMKVLLYIHLLNFHLFNKYISITLLKYQYQITILLLYK